MNAPCPQCGFANPPNFKFCGNCAAPLTGESPRPSVADRADRLTMPRAIAEKIAQERKRIEGERRQVTVLFADLAGFTSIAENLDPEEMFHITDAATRAFQDQIYAHEGTINKFMGDGVMAFFGAPIAHEDDPARAVRAALDIQAAIKKISQDLESRLNISLKVRVGLNTGTVVVGSIGSDLQMDYTAIGDTVNVAARLENVAEPGTILVSRSVYDVTQSLFHFRELGSIRVKGRVEPVEIFEALDALGTLGRERGIPGLMAPIVGRDAELARLHHAVERLLTHQRGQLVLVTGEAGIGKSRLKTEAQKAFKYQPLAVYEGNCRSYGQSAYAVFLELLKPILEIADSDNAEMMVERAERVVRGVMPESRVADVLPYLLNMFSLPMADEEMANRIRHLEPPVLQQQSFLAVRDFIVALAQERPLVLIFEDIHWIDPVSLDLLCFLIEFLHRIPALVYCNSRHAEGEGTARIIELGTRITELGFHYLPLTPLSHSDSLALVDMILSMPELPEHLKQTVPQRAEGNPYFLEEIIRMLIDRGIIHRAAGRWVMAPGVDARNFEVPSTLQGLIMARVDHLPENTRHALQCASVIGRDFSYRLLSQIVDDVTNLHEQVVELEERELITRVIHDKDIVFRFPHVLIQDTVYHSLLKKRREHLHEKIAQVIEQIYWDRIEDHIEELAFHYAESQIPNRALDYLSRAAVRAAARFANMQAIEYYARAVEFIPRAQITVQQTIDIYTGFGLVQFFDGQYDAAILSFQSALEVVRELPIAPTQIAELVNRLGRAYERKGDMTHALEWLQFALKKLDQDPGTARAVERAQTYNNIGWVHYRQGRYEEAYEWRMKSLQIIEGTEHYTEIASAYNGLVAVFSQKGDWKRCLAYAEKGLRLREMIGDKLGVSQSHTNLGGIALGQCQWDQAIYHYQCSLEIKQEVGDVAGIARLRNNLGSCYREKGDYAQAEELFRRALETAEKIKHNNLICFALNNMAILNAQENKFDLALGYASRCLDVANRIKSRELIAEAQWLIGEAAVGQNKFDLARTHAEQAATFAASIGVRTVEGQALRTLAKVARAQHRYDSAGNYLQRSLTIFSDLENPYELARSQYLLGLLLADQGKMTIATVAIENALNTFARLGAHGEQARARSELTQLNIPISSSLLN